MALKRVAKLNVYHSLTVIRVSPPSLTDGKMVRFSTQARKMRAFIELKHKKCVHDHGNFALLSLHPYEHPFSRILELVSSYINQC